MQIILGNYTLEVHVNEREAFETRKRKNGRTNVVRNKEYNGDTRMYFFHDGENILENLANRRDRPTETYRKLFVSHVLAACGIDLDVSAQWDQYAGCSCPCSPGFKLKQHKMHADIYVTIKHTPNVRMFTPVKVEDDGINKLTVRA